MNYRVLTDIPDHVKLQDSITLDLWPDFMLEDPVSNQNWMHLFEYFPDCQFSLLNDSTVYAAGNSIPLFFDDDPENLPEGGWDWAFVTGIEQFRKHVKPNVLCGLQIAVNKEYQGKGLSRLALEEMKQIARNRGFSSLILPVRPSQKSLFPHEPINDYILRLREDGLPYDPWLRVHVRNGGKIIKPCHNAMRIPGRVKDWEKWTKRSFNQSGDYAIEGALCPVSIDLERDLGLYIEPNVWVLHRL